MLLSVNTHNINVEFNPGFIVLYGLCRLMPYLRALNFTSVVLHLFYSLHHTNRQTLWIIPQMWISLKFICT